MRRFTSQNTVSAIKRQSYVGNLSTFTTVGSATCYLRPLSETESSDNGFQYGIGYNAIFEVDVDVREMDKLVIDSVEYLVKGVASHNRGGITKYKRAMVVRPQD